jgi:hypothetical protein
MAEEVSDQFYSQAMAGDKLQDAATAVAVLCM